MSRHTASPKPHPRTSALNGALTQGRDWRGVAAAVAAAMHPHLRKRTALARFQAWTTVHEALAYSGLLPIGGDIDESQADAVADLALEALSAKGLLSDRAEHLLTTTNKEHA